MIRLHDLEALRRWRRSVEAERRVGFVPTMGALHAGHASLVERAVAENDAAIVSVFVNPLQFPDAADLEAYPRTLEADCQRLEELGAAAVYLPAEDDILPAGGTTTVQPAPGSEDFEGAGRPGHFAGVLTIVLKLLQRVRPHRAYFGEKDAQQLFLVRRMAADLDLDVQIVGCPTVREEDGLAQSSRNVRLEGGSRDAARRLARAVHAARDAHARGERDPRALEAAMRAELDDPRVRVGYARVVEEASFRPAQPGGGGAWRAIVAAEVGGVRLLDNLPLDGAGVAGESGARAQGGGGADGKDAREAGSS